MTEPPHFETKLLLAVLNEDEPTAIRLIETMRPPVRRKLRRILENLGEMVDAVCIDCGRYVDEADLVRCGNPMQVHHRRCQMRRVNSHA